MYFKSYSEFKRAVDACDKFKITETQNESSQKSNKFPTSAQEEVQTEFVFVKIPKLWQMFGKIVLGVKVPKLWQFFGKIGLGKLRARALHSGKNTLPSDSGPYGEFKRATDACGKFKITEIQNESSQSLYSGKVPKILQIFGRMNKIELGVQIRKLWQIFRKIRLGKFRARAPKFRKHIFKLN